MIEVECPMEELNCFGGYIVRQSWSCVFTNLLVSLYFPGAKESNSLPGTWPEADLGPAKDASPSTSLLLGIPHSRYLL